MRLTLTLGPIHLLEFEIVCLKLELPKPPHHLPLSGHNSVAATARPLDGEKELERSYYYHLAEEEEETLQGDASMGCGGRHYQPQEISLARSVCEKGRREAKAMQVERGRRLKRRDIMMSYRID